MSIQVVSDFDKLIYKKLGHWFSSKTKTKGRDYAPDLIDLLGDSLADMDMADKWIELEILSDLINGKYYSASYNNLTEKQKSVIANDAYDNIVAGIRTCFEPYVNLGGAKINKVASTWDKYIDKKDGSGIVGRDLHNIRQAVYLVTIIRLFRILSNKYVTIMPEDTKDLDTDPYVRLLDGKEFSRVPIGVHCGKVQHMHVWQLSTGTPIKDFILPYTEDLTLGEIFCSIAEVKNLSEITSEMWDKILRSIEIEFTNGSIIYSSKPLLKMFQRTAHAPYRKLLRFGMPNLTGRKWVYDPKIDMLVTEDIRETEKEEENEDDS